MSGYDSNSLEGHGSPTVLSDESWELLRRRMAARVRESVLRALKIPAGISILGFGLGFLALVPETAKLVASVQRTVVDEEAQTIAAQFLKEEGAGRSILGEQLVTLLESSPSLRAAVQRGVVESLGDQLGEDSLLGSIAKPIADEVVERTVAEDVQSGGRLETMLRSELETYLRTEDAADALSKSVAAFLLSPSSRDALNAAVADRIAAAMNLLSGKIQDNNSLLVASATESAAPGRSRDGSPDPGDLVVRPEEATKGAGRIPATRKLPSFDSRSKDPVALKLVAGGRTLYDARAIKKYAEGLQLAARDRYQQVLILDPEGKFVALAAPDEFDRTLGRELVRVLNAEGRGRSLESTRKDLEPHLPAGATGAIRSDWTIEQALRSRVWKDPKRLDEWRAVIDPDGKFRGTTNRAMLLDALLDPE